MHFFRVQLSAPFAAWLISCICANQCMSVEMAVDKVNFPQLKFDNRHPQLDSLDKPVCFQGRVEKHAKLHTLMGAGKSENPTTDNSSGQLEGSADSKGHTCDVNDRELRIEWDDWRNKVACQIEANLSKHLQGWDGMEMNWAFHGIVPKYPSGIHTGIHLVISADQGVVEATVARTSGYPGYDKLVVTSAFELNKKNQVKLLRFPDQSQRTIVEQYVDYRTVNNHDSIYIKFNDLERIKLSRAL